MNLPFRIQSGGGTERVISVDGAFDAPGLNLSHWPGNATPAELRHDLSTGIALNFARLDADERDRLAVGCSAIANNHYDTDGVLAVFALTRPEDALPRAAAMLDAAAAGDLFRLPSERAFQIDVITTAMADVERSPIAAELSGRDDAVRWERATEEMLERLPRLLDGDLESERELWEGPLERLRDDLVSLERAARDDLVHFDTTVWTSPAGSAPSAFDPGRHALFGRTASDRVLVLGPSGEGTIARLILSTKSFFDLVTETTQPRPDLTALATRLNELEGSDAGSDRGWRHQPLAGASPELWFGSEGLGLYAEHATPHLAPSLLAPAQIKAEVVEALRRVFVFPDEEAGEDDAR